MNARASDDTSDLVLVVEDDKAQRLGLQQLVKSWGFTVDAAVDGADALQQATTRRPTIVLTDLIMPRMTGLELLKALRAQFDDDITVVLMTAQGTVETAVEALKEGAYDYLSKPIDPQRLKILLAKIVERQDTLREVRALRRQLRERGTFGKMVGQSAEMRKVYQIIEQAAPTNASVLVNGESGTGKELVAQTVHLLSPRAAQPYVPLNCAAIPDTLLESELFGHEKGAFTGAVARRQGVFELAHRGTIFFDEISEMTPATQAKLLRVLQEHTFRTLGGQREQTADVRIIAATNVDPREAVKIGKLREDLYYRLNVFNVQLPPLRDRKSDLPLLIETFITEFNTRNNRSVVGLTPRAMQMIERYNWPGNVRELRNVMERATIVAQERLVDVNDLPPLGDYAAKDTAVAAHAGAGLTPGTTVDEAEQQLITLTLEHTGGNKTHAASMLGISLKTLHNKLNRWHKS